MAYRPSATKMKKQKPPFVMITVLIVLISIVAAYNLVSSGALQSFGKSGGDGHDHGSEASAPEPIRKASGPTPAVDREQMKKQMQEMSRSRPPGPPAVPGQPTVKVPSATPPKPQPNDSSTSGQWYIEEARKPN